jgi:hypothetical protein
MKIRVTSADAQVTGPSWKDSKVLLKMILGVALLCHLDVVEVQKMVFAVRIKIPMDKIKKVSIN